jgi:hypothetical protein
VSFDTINFDFDGVPNVPQTPTKPLPSLSINPTQHSNDSKEMPLVSPRNSLIRTARSPSVVVPTALDDDLPLSPTAIPFPTPQPVLFADHDDVGDDDDDEFEGPTTNHNFGADFDADPFMNAFEVNPFVSSPRKGLQNDDGIEQLVDPEPQLGQEHEIKSTFNDNVDPVDQESHSPVTEEGTDVHDNNDMSVKTIAEEERDDNDDAFAGFDPFGGDAQPTQQAPTPSQDGVQRQTEEEPAPSPAVTSDPFASTAAEGLPAGLPDHPAQSTNDDDDFTFDSALDVDFDNWP